MTEYNLGLKYDSGKLRWDLLPIEEVEEIVQILTFGAEKYTDNSWQEVEKGIERYYAALMRHLVDWRKGEDIDPESKCRHLAHAACNVLFLLYLTKSKLGDDGCYPSFNPSDPKNTYSIELHSTGALE